LGSATKGKLHQAVPFTVEPGIYLPGKGGVRIEDTCVLLDDGLEIFTTFPRKLRRVG
jgi:Xaa-Pro dipeptidase